MPGAPISREVDAEGVLLKTRHTQLVCDQVDCCRPYGAITPSALPYHHEIIVSTCRPLRRAPEAELLIKSPDCSPGDIAPGQDKQPAVAHGWTQHTHSSRKRMLSVPRSIFSWYASSSVTLFPGAPCFLRGPWAWSPNLTPVNNSKACIAQMQGK